MKLELFAEKSFSKGSHWSIAILPQITVNYKLWYRRRELNFDIFWILWYVGAELTIDIDE